MERKDNLDWRCSAQASEWLLIQEERICTMSGWTLFLMNECTVVDSDWMSRSANKSCDIGIRTA